MANAIDPNAGLDFTIIVKDGLDLKEPFEELQDKALSEYLVFTSFITIVPSELEASKSIIIRGLRTEATRRKHLNLDKSLQVLSMIKAWLDSHQKSYRVETHSSLLRLVK